MVKMMKDMKKDPFEMYIKHTDPSKRELALAWNTAIGLQAVDGLETSDYLKQTALDNMEGKISISQAEQLIESYYEENAEVDTDRTKEADIVSTRIAAILSENSFTFSVPQYIGIHKRLFEGIYSHAGKLRDYNISKKEWVLDGASVHYGNALELRELLEYDLRIEKEYEYPLGSVEAMIPHLAKFVARLWQIHAFGEGNTRTTAVFFIKYLRSMGFQVTNDIFAEHAWYFRNALVRANYNDLINGVRETTAFLELFLRNLLLDEKNELRNRQMHIAWDDKIPALRLEEERFEYQKQDLVSTYENIDLITQLRKDLHNIAEISGQEVQTKIMLKAFLQKHTSLEVIDCGEGFYAAHREADATEGIAIRADYDALLMPDGTAKHLCGHDGHAAALCGVALAIERKAYGRNIFLLFQPAEETGEGAKSCTEIFEKEKISEIYGAHNLPGFAFGEVYTRPHTFACASRGVTLTFKGKPTHAAYPENGISPADAMGELLTALPDLSDASRYSGMTLCTIIGMHMGEKAFGAAPEAAEVWLTLRAEHDVDLEKLQADILALSKKLANKHQLAFAYEEQDVFPATENDVACATKVLQACDGQVLEVPMRWSEDFGHYLKVCKGAFLGIGAGEVYPPLHTEHYEYPDALLEPTVQTFLVLINA